MRTAAADAPPGPAAPRRQSNLLDLKSTGEQSKWASGANTKNSGQDEVRKGYTVSGSGRASKDAWKVKPSGKATINKVWKKEEPGALASANKSGGTSDD